MDAADLRVFEAVARLGSMNRAAAELNTVQSNVTARIRALEAQLGSTLFQRHSRGTEVTQAGQRLMPFAIRVARLLREAAEAVRDKGIPAGTLTIGSLETTAAHRLPQLLARFGTSYPFVDLVLRASPNATLVEAVRQQRLDGAFVCGPVHDPDLFHEVMFEEELVFVTAVGRGPFAEASEGPACRIVVKGPGCCYRESLEALLTKRGVQRISRVEVATVEAIVGCVAGGVGTTLLPRSVVEKPWREGRLSLHVAPPEIAKVETWFIWPAQDHVSAALTAFRDCMRDHVPSAQSSVA